MIPKQISDIDTEWLQDILEKVDKTKWIPDDCNLISLSLNTSKCEDELFECCNVSFNVSNKAQNEITSFHWLIKLVPTDPDLREIVLRHDLFKKELLIHSAVVPELKKYVTRKKGTKPTITLKNYVNFSLYQKRF